MKKWNYLSEERKLIISPGKTPLGHVKNSINVIYNSVPSEILELFENAEQKMYIDVYAEDIEAAQAEWAGEMPVHNIEYQWFQI